MKIVALFFILLGAEERVLVTHPFATLGSESNLTASISLGDVDGDGDLDAVVANGRHWAQQNFVFLNDGTGFFRTARRLGEELATSYRAALADFDGDGDLDVAVGNDRARKSLFTNDGDGHFSLSGTFGRDDVATRNIVIADVNGDGAPDILVTNRGAPNAVYFNDGTGGFEEHRRFGSERDSTISVAVADLDGDGSPDLVLANRDGQPNFGVCRSAQPLVLGRVQRIGDGNGQHTVAQADGESALRHCRRRVESADRRGIGSEVCGQVKERHLEALGECSESIDLSHPARTHESLHHVVAGRVRLALNGQEVIVRDEPLVDKNLCYPPRGFDRHVTPPP